MLGDKDMAYSQRECMEEVLNTAGDLFMVARGFLEEEDAELLVKRWLGKYGVMNYGDSPGLTESQEWCLVINDFLDKLLASPERRDENDAEEALNYLERLAEAWGLSFSHPASVVGREILAKLSPTQTAEAVKRVLPDDRGPLSKRLP